MIESVFSNFNQMPKESMDRFQTALIEESEKVKEISNAIY